MERRLAEKLAAEYLKFGEIFNRVTELSFEISDEKERKAVRVAMAEANFQLYDGLIRTIKAEYPDLDPPDGGD